jgi:glycosyltransferase involved in cell wall biosynthesis
MADMVVTVSHAMKDELIGLGFPRKRFSVSYNGVDPAKYNPEKFSKEDIKRIRAKYDIKDDEYMLLFWVGLSALKALINSSWLCPHILAKIPKAKLSSRVETSKSNLTNLTAITKMATTSNSLRLHPEEERINHYAACDVAVFPSYYEPFGIVP